MASEAVAAMPAAAVAAAPTATNNAVAFQTKKMPGGAHDTAGAVAASISPERLRFLEATLAKLPELNLSEMARVKQCFHSLLGEGRENMVNSLELRVALGELGLYPSEAELDLVLRAYRDRVNLVGLAQYLRLYKKEFWLNQVAARSSNQPPPPQQQLRLPQRAVPGSSSAHAGVGNNGRGVPHTYTAFSGSHASPGAAAAAAGHGSDEDTLKAFIALGGEEDGSGEIAATTLRDAVRGFGLTIDIDAMIRTVDVHNSGMLDYVDFCALWASPSDANAGDSMGHALQQASADGEQRMSLGDGVYATLSDTHRRLLSVLLTPSHRASRAPSAQARRRSYLGSTGYEQGLSQPTTPRQAGSNLRSAVSAGGGRGPVDNGAEGGVITTFNAPAARQASVPAPITEDEHALLVRMFLFPDQFDSVSLLGTSTSSAAGTAAAGGGGRRGNTRFALPSAGGAGGAGGAAVNGYPMAAGGANPGNPPGTANSTRDIAASVRNGHPPQQQQQLSRSTGANRGGYAGGSVGRTRGPSQRSRRMGGTRNASNNGRRRKGNHNNGGSDFDDDDDDLTADFFSPKNQNVYRPPSPMILSMRNSTAYRNRLKRLEEQKHAARGDRRHHNQTQQQQQRSLHAATVARDGGAGGYGYGADNENAVRSNKASTW